MAQRADSRHRYTYAEYLAYERDSELKHEFVDGEILAMAGGTLRHGALASRVSAALEANQAPGCVAFSSDVKIRVLATGRAYYPDASMVCGPTSGNWEYSETTEGTLTLAEGAELDLARLYADLPP